MKAIGCFLGRGLRGELREEVPDHLLPAGHQGDGQEVLQVFQRLKINFRFCLYFVTQRSWSVIFSTALREVSIMMCNVSRPQEKVCNGQGEEECRTVYESSCTTKYVIRTC